MFFKHKAMRPAETSDEKIELAYRNEKIDEKTRILAYLKLLFDKNRLTGEFTSGAPLKSGTPALEEVYRYIWRRDADSGVVEAARGYLNAAVPSLDRVYTSPGGFFKIHYTLAGKNAVPDGSRNAGGVPSYIKAVGAAFDNVKAFVCDERGFKLPVIDDSRKVYDIYVYDLQGKYGITFASKFHASKPAGHRISSSYICIDNTYDSSKGFEKSRDDCMKVTAAHEFFHAVQNSYSFEADTWWKEATATWNEDEVYNTVNDYFQYVGKLFASPEKPLDRSNYGGVVFAKYLSERVGGYKIIRRIWEIQAQITSDSHDAIDRAVREKLPNESIGSIFSRYAASNFNPSQYYSEGGMWNSSVSLKSSYSDYPVTSRRDTLNHMSAGYILFKPDTRAPGKTLKIKIDEFDKVNWGFKIQKRRTDDNMCSITEFGGSGTYDRVETICSGFGDKYKEICLMISDFPPARLAMNNALIVCDLEPGILALPPVCDFCTFKNIATTLSTVLQSICRETHCIQTRQCVP